MASNVKKKDANDAYHIKAQAADSDWNTRSARQELSHAFGQVSDFLIAQVEIPLGRPHVGMPQGPADGDNVLAVGYGERSEAVAQVVYSHPAETGGVPHICPTLMQSGEVTPAALGRRKDVIAVFGLISGQDDARPWTTISSPKPLP